MVTQQSPPYGGTVASLEQQALLDLCVQAKARIESRKQELAAARQWRQQQEEYEVGGTADMRRSPTCKDQCTAAQAISRLWHLRQCEVYALCNQVAP